MRYTLREGGRVQRGQVAGGEVPEQVHPIQAEAGAQRFHVVGEPVAAVAERVARIC